MIGYFWVFLGLTLKARELATAERAPQRRHGAAPPCDTARMPAEERRMLTARCRC